MTKRVCLQVWKVHAAQLLQTCGVET